MLLLSLLGQFQNRITLSTFQVLILRYLFSLLKVTIIDFRKVRQKSIKKRGQIMT